MTTTTAFDTELDALADIHRAEQDIDHSHDANRSTTLLLMNEALARMRMRRPRQEQWGGKRPAREVAMLAAKRREQF